MLQQATRIRGRAIRLCGELLKQIEPGQGVNQNIGVADDTIFTRTDAAERAGISKRQAVTAIRVANVPAEEFERHNYPPASWLCRVASGPVCPFCERVNQEGPMDKMLRDPFTLIAALMVAVLAVEILAVHWL